MKSPILGSAILLTATLSITGCGFFVGHVTKFNRDVTEVDRYWGGYQRGQSYELTEDVLLIEQDYWPRDLALSAGMSNKIGRGEYIIVDSNDTNLEDVDQYKADPDRWPSVLGLVTAGTQLEVTEIRQRGAVTWGSTLNPYAVIRSGEHAGKLVEIYDLSYTLEMDVEPTPQAPRPKVLKLVK